MADRKVKICSDSSCDLGKELCEKFSIPLNYFTINLGDDSYTDGVDITPDDLYAYHEKTGSLPKTAAINIAEHTDFFNEQLKDCDELVFFSISSKLSSSCQYAKLAAEDFDNVYVIDSNNLSTGVGLLVLAAKDMADAGLSAKEIVNNIEELKDKVNASFVIDSLEYLHKGGRCSALAALGANLLKLKPCIQVKDGSMGVNKKYRGRFEDVIKTYAEERTEDTDNIVKKRVFVTHAGCEQSVIDSVTQIVKKNLNPDEIYITRAGSTISVHCGRNTLGVLFIQETTVE